MPVVDGELVPRAPLTPAELHVDYVILHRHIEDRRAAAERACKPALGRITTSVVELGLPSTSAVEQLRTRLEQTLTVTARLGYRTARTEITSLRNTSALAEHVVPDAGQHAATARGGWTAILTLIRRRAHATATAVAAAAGATPPVENEPALTRTAVLAAATRALHNHVLELVGETINLGRAHGVMSMSEPPEFAMRSEQLDKATCDACTRLHGAIVVVGSADFYSYMPPAGCFGGGRCRGIYVFGDDRAQVRGPDTAPGPQPELPEIRPVPEPVRRAA